MTPALPQAQQKHNNERHKVSKQALHYHVDDGKLTVNETR